MIDAGPVGVAALRETLDAAGADYLTSRAWTTEAFYREPRAAHPCGRRVEEGYIVVEMEASAFIAVARFRGVRLRQLLYAGNTWPATTGRRATGRPPSTSDAGCSTSRRPLRCG